MVCPDVITCGQCCGAVKQSVSLPRSLPVGFSELRTSVLAGRVAGNHRGTKLTESLCVELGSVACPTLLTVSQAAFMLGSHTAESKV